MHKPVHPGRIIRDEYLKELNLTIGEVAKSLDVSRQTVDAIVNERAGISSEMALRLAKAFNTSPELWLNMQQNYDLWKARRKQRNLSNVKTLYRPAS